MDAVLISIDLFLTILRLCLLLNFLFRLRICIKRWRHCFIGYPGTLIVVKNSPSDRIFNSSRCLDILMKQFLLCLWMTKDIIE